MDVETGALRTAKDLLKVTQDRIRTGRSGLHTHSLSRALGCVSLPL